METSSAAGRGSGALFASQREPGGQDGVGNFVIGIVSLLDDLNQHIALGADGAE